MHKRHGGAAENLRSLEEACGFSPVGLSEDRLGELGEEKAAAKAEDGGKHESVDYLDPFAAVDAVEIAVKSDGSAGKTGNQRMAFTRGDPKVPRERRPNDDGEKRGAERGRRLLAVSVEIDHIFDGHGYRGVEERHDENAEEIEYGGHEDRPHWRHRPRGNTGRNGVWRVRPAVDKDDA